MKKFLPFFLVLILTCSAYSNSDSSHISNDPSGEIALSPDASSNIETQYGIVSCSYDETLAFVDSEAAREQSMFFAKWGNEQAFKNGEEFVLNSDLYVLWWFAPELYDEFGESGSVEDGFFFSVPKSVIDKLLFKYFGVESYDPEKSPCYRKENGSFYLSLSSEGAPWVIDHIEVQDIGENIVTYKYAFHYGIFDDSPGPFQAAYMTLETLKDNGEIFFRLVSKSGITKEFHSPEESLSALEGYIKPTEDNPPD